MLSPSSLPPVQYISSYKELLKSSETGDCGLSLKIIDFNLCEYKSDVIQLWHIDSLYKSGSAFLKVIGGIIFHYLFPRNTPEVALIQLSNDAFCAGYVNNCEFVSVGNAAIREGTPEKDLNNIVPLVLTAIILGDNPIHTPYYFGYTTNNQLNGQCNAYRMNKYCCFGRKDYLEHSQLRLRSFSDCLKLLGLDRIHNLFICDGSQILSEFSKIKGNFPAIKTFLQDAELQKFFFKNKMAPSRSEVAQIFENLVECISDRINKLGEQLPAIVSPCISASANPTGFFADLGQPSENVKTVGEIPGLIAKKPS